MRRWTALSRFRPVLKAHSSTATLRLVASQLHGLPEFPGLGGESAYIESHLLDKRGRIRDLNEVKLGSAIAQFVLLDYELREPLRRPKARGYPPRVFISYHRQSPEHIDWCRALSGELRAAGYRVLLDAEAMPAANPSPEEVARFVGRLATADVALVVLTRGYLGDAEAGTMRRWLFEEWQRIIAMRELGLIEIVCVLREGEPTSHGVHPDTTLDAVIDLRDRAVDDRGPVLDFFGTYRGPIISDADSTRLAATASTCLIACEARDQKRATATLDQITDLRGTEPYDVADVALRATFGTQTDAVRAAGKLLRTNPTYPVVAALAESLWLADLDLPAFAVMAPIAASTSVWRPWLHEAMGKILLSRGELLGALNHWTWFLNFRHSGLEARWKRQERVYDRERVMWLERRLLFSRQRPPLLRCDVCGARYDRNGQVCLLCGTPDHTARAKRCPLCGYPVVAVQTMPFCPTCHVEFTERNGARCTAALIERRVGGTFSVLWPYANPGNWVIADGMRTAWRRGSVIPAIRADWLLKADELVHFGTPSTDHARPVGAENRVTEPLPT